MVTTRLHLQSFSMRAPRENSHSPKALASCNALYALLYGCRGNLRRRSTRVDPVLLAAAPTRCPSTNSATTTHASRQGSGVGWIVSYTSTLHT